MSEATEPSEHRVPSAVRVRASGQRRDCPAVCQRRWRGRRRLTGGGGRRTVVLAMLNATRELILPMTITGSYRRIAFYRAVAINLGANIVRRELKLPEVEITAADSRWTFAG